MITFQDGDIIPILGKKWILKLRKSTDEEWLILVGDEQFAGVITATKDGGFMYVLTDVDDPRESLIHELIEAFLTEMGRLLNEKGGE